MGSPAANPRILYRNSRLLRMVFLQLHRQQRAGLFCDVVLQAEGEAVPAHCCILSAYSPFFTERLEREMPPQGQKVVLELQGLKIGPLRKLVDFLYTSEMDVSREEAQDVLAAARQLQVSELESLQLEGGKLVRKALGRRLDRGCLQLPSPGALPEGSLLQSPPPRVCCRTPRPLAREQQAAVQPPSAKGRGHSSSASQEESAQGETATESEDKPQVPGDALALPEFLTAKATKCLAGTGKNSMGSQGTGTLQAGQARPRVKHGGAGLQESKKIKLSRPRLSSPALPMSCTTAGHRVLVPSNISRSIRRLWRKKSPPVKDDAKGAEMLSHLEGCLSPSLLPKAIKGRRRSSSEPAPIASHPQEAGQVGRVKLRKVLNGGCWEVVQEPSGAQPTRAGPSVCALAGECSSPQPRCTEPKAAATRQPAGPPTPAPAEAESSSLPEKTLAGEAGRAVALAGGRDPTQLLRPDQLAEGERCDNPASAGELEHMLGLLLAEGAAVGESRDTTAPEGRPASGPAPKTSSVPRGDAEAEAKHRRSAEGHIHPQWIKKEESPALGGEGCAASKVREGMSGLTSGVPFLESAYSCVPLATSHICNKCIPFHGHTSPQEENLTASLQVPLLENGALRLPGPWPSPEAQGLPSCGEATSGAEAKPQAQALQHPLACQLPPQLVIAEEDEIDVASAERGVLECSDPSPGSCTKY